MATNLYSFIQTNINLGRKLHEILDAILKMKNDIQINFRKNQQMFRNKKSNIKIVLNQKTSQLRSLQEKIVNINNKENLLKINHDNNFKEKNKILNILKFANEKLSQEKIIFESKELYLLKNIEKNKAIIDLCKNFEKIILEENRIPNIDIEIHVNINMDIDINKDKDRDTHKEKDKDFPFSIILKSNEKNNIIDINKFNKNKNFLIDEAFISFEIISKLKLGNENENLNLNKNTFINNNDNNNNKNNNIEITISFKERIITILTNIINSKNNELDFIEKKIEKLRKYYKIFISNLKTLKDFYLKKIENLNKNNNDNDKDNDNSINYYEEQKDLFNTEKKMIEKSIESTIEDIDFHTNDFKKEEKIYADLVRNTKIHVKAINQIKKYLINNYSHFKDYLMKRVA